MDTNNHAPQFNAPATRALIAMVRAAGAHNRAFDTPFDLEHVMTVCNAYNAAQAAAMAQARAVA